MLTTDRQSHLDALRGLAAMIVVTTHFFASLYPWAVFADVSRTAGAPPEPRFGWEAWLHWPPFSLLTAGHFAVCLFFVLSGYVLSVQFIGEPAQARHVIGAMIKRPFRLAGLALVSLLIGATLWSTDLLLNRALGSLVGYPGWLESFWVGEFSWSGFANDLLVGRAGGEYNPPLWTIKIEIIGSFLVFFVLLVINPLARWARCLAMGGLILALQGTYYDGFIIGMLLADGFKSFDARQGDRRVDALRERQTVRSRLAFWVSSAMTLALAGYPYYAAAALLPDHAALTAQVGMLSATLVLVLMHFSLRWRRGITYAWTLRLGELSYAIYVLHFLLLQTVTAWLVIHLNPLLGYGWAGMVAGLMSLPLLFGLANLATRWIDRPCIALGRWVEQQYRRQVWPQRIAPRLPHVR